MDSLIGKLLSHYRIERELGRGGMAMVYLADDQKHGRQVAIKVMHPEMAAAIGQVRFLREIEIAARLTHPHIVSLFDSGVLDGQLYYVMPYITGESLRARLDRERQIPLDEALRLTREIASGLSFAHHQGLVHRDIKPENVLLSDGFALVTDFGIAREVSVATDAGEPAPPIPPQGSPAALVDPGGPTVPPAAASGALTQAQTIAGESTSGNTMPGLVVGTPRYMAPEQASGGELDGRTDLYALACVLYEMLAGRPPFLVPGTSAMLQMHLSQEPRPVTDYRDSVPASISAVIARALSKAPADRYPTMARFAEALAGAALAGSSATGTHTAVQVGTPNNLPRQRTHFIGRERELAECERLLKETRLFTLTGIGGCGKTRIALKLAQRVLADYPNGVWFVDLAPLNDADGVVQTVAIAVGVREELGTPLLETLARHFAAQRSLIILDNCEHVLGAAEELVDRLLAGSGELKLVVTSREGLGIEGERLLPLRSLSVPAAGEGADIGAIESSEAVRLFVDRARVVDESFQLTERTAPAVAEICRRLDGIPLAIELAAARVKVLKVEDIRAKLDDRFRLLTGGSKSALARHRTLLATIQWSYDHLSEDEQRLFRLLAVFSGGWTLDGATRIAGEDSDEFLVLDTITRLADKSLIGIERGALGDLRYSMLETVRQYAQERLEESGEGEAARSRHLGFYHELAAEAEARLFGPEQGSWLGRLDRERENLLLALGWCDRAEGGAQRGLKVVHAVMSYWIRRGMLEQGYRVTTEALGRAGAEERSPARCRALFAAGQLRYFMGRYDQAMGHLEESLRIALQLGDRDRASAALRMMGSVAHAQGDVAAARGHLEEGLLLARELGDKYRLSSGLNGLAELYRAEGNLEAAEPLYEEALALVRERGDHDSIAIFVLNLAMVSVGRGKADRVRELLIEALAIAGEMGSRYVGQLALDVCVGLGASSEEWEWASRLFGASEAQRRQMGAPRDPADEAFIAPLVARARAALGESQFSAVEASGRALGYEEALAMARLWLAPRP